MSAEEMMRLIGGLKVQHGAIFNPPASRSDIEFFERSMQLELPDDLKLLYSLSDGFDIGMFRIVPLTEALNYASELKKGQFYLAEYMIYSDCWIVDLGKGNGYEIKNDQDTGKRFGEITAFLSAFLEGGVEGLFEQRVEV
ncbi:hypothetical protein [Polluticoccus soli]|uniref:hypothetical protein n=1 Tax=Polluticoccus soli TaxID=3034150 RepID=UPI0023E0A800|nr:hypothetical protein [Flavipsychrobacter sp. JY13-12]